METKNLPNGRTLTTTTRPISLKRLLGLLLVYSRIRGVQYVHCVMHKCIMVKVGGHENHRKYVKKSTEI